MYGTLQVSRHHAIDVKTMIMGEEEGICFGWVSKECRDSVVQLLNMGTVLPHHGPSVSSSHAWRDTKGISVGT
jgi:hypothetical protein